MLKNITDRPSQLEWEGTEISRGMPNFENWKGPQADKGQIACKRVEMERYENAIKKKKSNF